MTRLVPVTVLVVLVMTGRPAHAQGSGSSMLPSGATIAFERRKIFDFDDDEFREPDAGSTELQRYFNLAQCTCAKAHAGDVTTKHAGNFQYLVIMHALSGAGKAVPVDFWVGSSCTDMTARNPSTGTCKLITSIPDIDKSLYPGGSYQEFNLYDVVNGKTHQGEACLQSDNVTAPIYAFVNTTGMADTYDYMTSQNTGLLTGDTTTSGVDTQPPPAPTNLVGKPSENAIQLSWNTPTSRATDVYVYQALCSKVDGSQARSDPPAALYKTTSTACNIPDDPMLLVSSDGGISSSPPLPDQLKELHADRICGQTASGTATSLTIDHLQNDVPYDVVLLAVDLHGNYAGTYLADTVTPHLVTDFWEDLHDPRRGSEAEGGLCLLAETYGDDSTLTRMLRAFRDDTLGASRPGRWLTEAYYASLGRFGAIVHGSTALRAVAAVALAPLVALALLWHWLTLPGLLGLVAAAWWLWRRRRAALQRPWLPVRASGAIAGLAVLLALGTGRAHAGGGFQPYWEEDPTEQNKNEAAADEPGLAKWHAGIRVGPYVPDIDKQLGLDPGPYKQMFGGYRILPMLDVDRFLWTDVGQLGVGISLGYMQKTARAFAMGSDPSLPDRPREPGAKTAFRLIPLALTGTYRFTLLDDNYGVPLVPYVRGGLAYYIWWITAPNGGFARVCKDPMMAFPCAAGENKALGASLGLTGSIGLAVRAERIDASAAISMRQSGIQHAGVYAELSLAKVDGFGSDKKLSVGDRTWFAGVDFEF